MQSNQESDLAARWTRKELAERYEFGVMLAAQPSAISDVGTLEIAEVGDRSAERGETQFEGGPKHFPRGPNGTRRSCNGGGGFVIQTG